jgi:hypothetical protein
MENKIRELENRIAKLEQIILYLAQRKDIPKYCDLCHEIYDLDDESVKIYNCQGATKSGSQAVGQECNKHMCINCTTYYCETCNRWNHSECLSGHALVFFCSPECIESKKL